MGHLVARKGGKAYHMLYTYSIVGQCDSGTSVIDACSCFNDVS